MSTPTTTQNLAREAPTIRYRGVSEPVVGTDAPSVAPQARPAVLQWLTRGVFAVVIAVWAVVGLIVWVPLLVREMLRLSVALVGATLHREYPAEAARSLQAAVDFYRSGFVMAADAVQGRTPQVAESPRRTRSTRFANEFVWAAAIWYAIFAAFGLVWSPLEAGRWALGLPWSDWAVSVGAWIVEPFV